MLQTINPATGALVTEYAEHTPAEVTALIDRANDTFIRWRRTSFSGRAELMMAVADVLEKRSAEWGELMTIEMGKTVASAKAEIEKCAWVCRHYAEQAGHMLADQAIETGRTKSYLHHEPLGVVLAVMPWNFPFWQVFRFAAPALMAGNVGVLKHASNVTGSALAIEAAFTEAGFPEGAFTTLLLPGSRVSEVLEHPKVVAATLTGSDPAGRAVASKAGSLLKKTLLELGGSDPYVILEDADIESSAATCATSRMINGGQSCIAAKRFIVHDAVYEPWLEVFVEKMAAMKMGDPFDPTVQLGPQARHDLRDELHDQVVRSVAAGANLVLGGEVPDLPGAFYPPTVLTDVRKGMPAYSEEMFGPVATVIRVSSEAEAIEVANDSMFGLGAAVFTADLARGERIAAEWLEAGCCFVNALVASDPRLPFGGIKTSGYGRELAHLGIYEFTNQKTVVVA